MANEISNAAQQIVKDAMLVERAEAQGTITAEQAAAARFGIQKRMEELLTEKPVEPKAGETLTHKSTITGIGPVRAVWEIAEANPGMRRCDVIRLAEAAGIATYTARTQYQRWFSWKKEQLAGTRVP